MVTLTVDDRELVVAQMRSILQKLDPDGTHLGATRCADALRMANESPLDVAFLDVEMPGESDGISLGKQLKRRFPKLNIVIITGHREYALDAFDLDASGYLLKPLTQDAVAHQLSVLRYDREALQEKKIRIRCFGLFEVYCGGAVMNFYQTKTKELLACLVDHNGALCPNDTLIGCLWPDKPADQNTKANLRKCVKELKDSFAAVGAGDVILQHVRVGIGLDMSKIDCDYYRYLQGDPVAVHQYKGKYMTQYDFAEETRSALLYSLRRSWEETP